MKKVLLIIILLVVVVGIVVLVVECLKMNKKEERKGALIVNGDNLSSDGVTLLKQKGKVHAQVPLLVVLEKIGCDIEWETQKHVVIYCQTEKYMLDFQNESFTNISRPNNNLLIPTPGGTYFYCLFTNYDVIVDDLTLESIFFFMDISSRVDVDFEQGTVSVTPKV